MLLRPLQVDLAILTAADHFIAHCPSSFSHIAARMRKESTPPRSVSYWGMGGDVASKTLAPHELADGRGRGGASETAAETATGNDDSEDDESWGESDEDLR